MGRTMFEKANCVWVSIEPDALLVFTEYESALVPHMFAGEWRFSRFNDYMTTVYYPGLCVECVHEVSEPGWLIEEDGRYVESIVNICRDFYIINIWDAGEE